MPQLNLPAGLLIPLAPLILKARSAENSPHVHAVTSTKIKLNRDQERKGTRQVAEDPDTTNTTPLVKIRVLK